MFTFLVMDHSGHSTLDFDGATAEDLARGQAMFAELTRLGYTAYTRTGPGTAALVRTFDPARKETLFRPRLVGG